MPNWDEIIPSLADDDVIVFVRDMEGRYVWVNDNYGKFLPFTREQVIGKTNRELHGEQAASWELTDALTVASNTYTVTEETALDPRDGKFKRYLMTKIVVTVEGERYIVGATVEMKHKNTTAYERRLGYLRASILQAMIGDNNEG